MRVSELPRPDATPRVPTILAIGSLAAEALAASRGRVGLFSLTGGAAYLEAGREIIWARRGDQGGSPAPSHVRAMLLHGPLPQAWTGVQFAAGGIAPWRPAFPLLVTGGRESLAARARAFAAWLAAAEQPRGLGALLAGKMPDFPLAAATPRVLAMFASEIMQALPDGDIVAAAEAAAPLIGLGPGLTPSGDDLLAGMLLALRLRAIAEPRLTAAVERLGGAVRGMAHAGTNRISATLLGDASRGHGFAAMHALIDALATGNRAAAFASGRSLAALGHSSGWDLMTGLCAGLGVVLEAPRG